MRAPPTILCAVNFDEGTRGLVRAAALLAKGAGAELELLHVAEAWDQFGIVHFLGHDTRAHDLVRVADTETFQRAETLLVQLSEELTPAEIPVRTRVLKGNAGEVLVAEARRLDAWVVSGIKKNYSNFYPKNISTTLTLASGCQTPVLFIPKGEESQLERSCIRILASDDLKSDGSRLPIEIACQFAQWYEEADIWHVHVSALNEESLNASITTAFAESRTPFEPSLAGKELFQLMTEAMQRRLIKRLSEDVDCPARHHSVLRFGNVETELTALRDEHGLNVAVFGRHQPFHKDPFYVGNLPTAAMFNLDIPVIITPS